MGAVKLFFMGEVQRMKLDRFVFVIWRDVFARFILLLAKLLHRGVKKRVLLSKPDY